jgi:DNA-binding response OmpR family regulator
MMAKETQDPICVLFIGDKSKDARRLVETLEAAKDAGPGAPAFQVEHVDRLDEGLERLVAGGIDIVLLDLSLSDAQDLTPFIHIRAQAAQIPTVVLCNPDDEGLAVMAVREGAQDYLVKDQIDGRHRTHPKRSPMRFWTACASSYRLTRQQ